MHEMWMASAGMDFPRNLPGLICRLWGNLLQGLIFVVQVANAS
jgi:hypothetical protein